uniref:Dachshund a n=1 Tax=Sinocyclocheilus anshuiensis TaxID=1608454 RepID=A0A671LAW7_9TELE
MAVSATPPVLSPTSTPGGASSLFRPDSLYSSPAESPQQQNANFNISAQPFKILSGVHEMYIKLQHSRPGRPPKRSLGVVMQDSSRLLPHSVHGLLSPSLLSPTGKTPLSHGAGSEKNTQRYSHSISLSISLLSPGGSESSWDKEKLQSPPSSRAQHGLAHAFLSAQHGLSGSHLSSLQQSHLLANRLDLPFMMMPHPLLPVSLPPASVAMAMNQMNHLNTIANMAAAAQMHSPLSRAGASVIKECVQDSPSPAPSLEETPHPGSQPSSHPSSSVSSSPNPHTQSPERLVLNPTDGELPERDTGINMKKILKEKDEAQLALPIQKPGFEKLPLGTQTLPPGFPAPFLFADGLSSVETLLTNIQVHAVVILKNLYFLQAFFMINVGLSKKGLQKDTKEPNEIRSPYKHICKKRKKSELYSVYSRSQVAIPNRTTW